MITRWCGSSCCVQCVQPGRDHTDNENSWPFLPPPLLLCPFKATWWEGLWECEFRKLCTLQNHQLNGVCNMSMVADCICCVSVSVTFVGCCGFYFPWWGSPSWFWTSLWRLAGGEHRISWRLAKWPFLPTFPSPERYFSRIAHLFVTSHAQNNMVQISWLFSQRK